MGDHLSWHWVWRSLLQVSFWSWQVVFKMSVAFIPGPLITQSCLWDSSNKQIVQRFCLPLWGSSSATLTSALWHVGSQLRQPNPRVSSPVPQLRPAHLFLVALRGSPGPLARQACSDLSSLSGALLSPNLGDTWISLTPHPSMAHGSFWGVCVWVCVCHLTGWH